MPNEMFHQKQVILNLFSIKSSWGDIHYTVYIGFFEIFKSLVHKIKKMNIEIIFDQIWKELIYIKYVVGMTCIMDKIHIIINDI